MPFLAPPCVCHDATGAKMMPPSGMAHPHLHSVQA